MIEIGGRQATGTADASVAPRRRPGWHEAGLALALAVPFAVAIAQLRSPDWYANLDLALIELRVRDVGTGHSPLVGVSGRFDWNGVPGSHPGPILFWVLAPLYRLFGSSSWALEAAVATLGFAATGVATWLGWRRAGRVGALAVALGMAVLLLAYGPATWTLPWNPYPPLLWWPVVLLAVWSVLCDDLVGLPVAVGAGSLCVQAHISFLGLVSVLVLLAVAALVVGRRSRDGARPARVARWAAASALLLLALWAPPLLEQVRNDPGNLTILGGHFLETTEPAIGIGAAIESFLQRLDPIALASRDPEATGSVVAGVIVLVAWVTAAVASLRRPAPRELRALHAVVAAALVAGLAVTSRIQGMVFEYLVLWAWATTILAVAAVIWTVVALRPPAPRPRRSAAVPLTALLVVAIVVATWDAAGVDQPQPGQARLNGELVPETVAALDDGVTADGDPIPGAGEHARFLVRSADPVSGGLNTYTLLLELEREGFDAGVDPGFAVTARPHRVVRQDDATAIVVYAVGPAVDDLRAVPGAVEIARAEPTAADRATLDRLREEVADDLVAHGLGALVPDLRADDLLLLGIDTRVPMTSVRLLRRMIELGAPTSVFVTPVP